MNNDTLIVHLPTCDETSPVPNPAVKRNPVNRDAKWLADYLGLYITSDNPEDDLPF